MRKLGIGFLIVMLGVALAIPGWAKTPSSVAEGKVVWEIYKYVKLKLSDTNYTFPKLEPGTDEYLAEDAMILYVESNTDWSLSFELEGDAEAIAHLSVLLGQTSGSGSAAVSVDYKLSDLRTMAPGKYQVTVVYTATTE